MKRPRGTRTAKPKQRRRPQGDADRKLRFLLELGQLIGLDLDIDDMLIAIARKAADVTDSERFAILLYDAESKELWGKLPTPEGVRVLRTPPELGISGFSFRTGKTVNVRDVSKDPRFYKNIDLLTGRRTKSLLSVPFQGRSGQPLGVIELINKKSGVFTREDELFLKTFSNHIKVFIEMAQLQKARLEAISRAKEDLEQLNRAKGKALDHLSHEMKTPLAVMQGIVRVLSRKSDKDGSLSRVKPLFDILERNLSRLLGLEEETEEIVKTHQEVEGGFILKEFDRLWRHLAGIIPIPHEVRVRIADLHGWLAAHLPHRREALEHILILPFLRERIAYAQRQIPHREITLTASGDEDLYVLADPHILSSVVDGLLKNAIENTPDEGKIEVTAERDSDRLVIRVRDFGVGITGENREHVFDGLFHTQEDIDYGSKRPYDFSAGGKGLELLLMKIYGQLFGFRLSVESSRCIYLPTDKDLCPGRISLCSHCKGSETCTASGGSVFSVFFPLAGGYMLKYDSGSENASRGNGEKHEQERPTD